MVVLYLFQQGLQHHVLLLQLADLPLEVLLSVLETVQLFFHGVHLFDCVSFLLLVQFGTFTVATDALAFLAIAAFVAIPRTFIEEFSHLMGIEIGLADLTPHSQVMLKGLILKQHKLRPQQQQEHGKNGIQSLATQLMQKLLFIEILPPPKQ